MIRTKHAYIAALLSIALLIVLLCSIRGMYHNAIHTDNVFVESESVYGVAESTPVTHANRVAFIERVRESLRADTSSDDVAETDYEETHVLKTEHSFVGASVSSAPRKGSLYACAGEGVDVAPITETTWITDGVYDETKKSVIEGVYTIPSLYTIYATGTARVINTNGIPKHAMGTFPTSPDDGINIHASVVQSFMLDIPRVPVRASQVSCVPRGEAVGVLHSGALIYSGVLSGDYDARAHSRFDACNGHVDTQGVYHYHTESTCVKKDDNGSVGYALDGFGIYPQVENGAPVDMQSLDACNGHAHIITWDGIATYMYHYHMTDTYPYTVSCFMGTPRPIVTGG